jgi:hypothetical protein
MGKMVIKKSVIKTKSTPDGFIARQATAVVKYEESEDLLITFRTSFLVPSSELKDVLKQGYHLGRSFKDKHLVIKLYSIRVATALVALKDLDLLKYLK